MIDKTFSKHHEGIAHIIYVSAYESMKEISAHITIDFNKVGENSVPWITIVSYGAWLKGSCNVKNDEASGVVKNKVCNTFNKSRLAYAGKSAIEIKISAAKMMLW